MFGVYYIGKTDDVWTLVTTETSFERAETLMDAYKRFVTKHYGDVLSCVAVSEGNREKHIPRAELKATTCEA